MRSYRQFTKEQRYQVYALKKVGLKQSKIALLIGVDKRAISRKYRRNSALWGRP